MSTHLQLRQVAAKALDDWGGYGVTSASGSSYAIMGALRDVTPNASANRFDGAWLYSPSDGSVRRAIRGGLTTSSGRVDVELEWGIPTIGSVIEITRLFPVREAVAPEDVSYQTLIRRATASMIEPRRIAIAATTADSYTVGATYPWLDRESRIVRDERGRWLILETAQTPTRHPVSCAWRGWHLVQNGAATALQLDVPFSAPTGTIYVDVMAPVWTFINGAESTAGLVADADYVSPSVDDCLPFVLFEAYRALVARAPGRVYPEAAQQMAYYDGVRRKSRYWDRTSELDVAAPAETEAA